MKNLFRYILTAIIAVFVFGAASQISAQDAQYVRALYQKMDANQKSLKSLRSRVRMEHYNSQLREIETTQDGEVLYLPAKARSANIRINWQAPQQEILSVVNGEYKLYRPRLQQVLEGKTKDVQKQQGVGSSLDFINMSAQQLKQNFDAKYLGGELIASGSMSAHKLKLTPKTAMRYNFAEVWIDDSGMPVQVKIHEKNGDTTTVLLYDTKKNAKVSLDEVKFKVPSGAKVIKG